MLQTFSTQAWNEHQPDSNQQHAIQHLENGQILYFPKLVFALLPEEHLFLSPDFADPHAKNISYQSDCNKLWGVQHLTDSQHVQLKSMLDRFCQYSFNLIQSLLPHYAPQL